jgi:hypothetical protein
MPPPRRLPLSSLEEMWIAPRQDGCLKAGISIDAVTVKLGEDGAGWFLTLPTT